MLFAISANSRAAAKRRTYEAYSDDGPPCWANLLMFIGAVGCLVSSITLFSDSFFHTRETKVEEFGHSISNWTSYRDDFMKSNFSVGVEVHDKIRPTTAHLHKDYTPEISGMIEEGDVAVPSYEPLKFDINESPPALFPTLNYSMPPDESAVFVITASYFPPDKEEIKSVFKTSYLPLWTKKVVPGATPVPERKCPDQQHGTWIRNRCEIYRRLISLCFLVDFDRSTGSYYLSPQRHSDPDSYGCERKMTEGVHWNPATYTLVRATASYDGDTQATIYAFPETNLDDVSITIRSAHDPFIEAEKVTKGSLDFGLSSHNSLVLGIILLLIGTLLSVSPCLAIRQSYKDYTIVDQLTYTPVKEFDDFDEDMEELGEPIDPQSEVELASLSRRSSKKLDDGP